MKCIIYTRFSPRPDAATSESCEVQFAYCEEYAIKKGWDIRERFDDPDVSGSDEFREKLWAAIESLKKGEVLLVYKRDRLARNVYLSESINRAVSKKGATIVAVDGDVAGDGPEQQLIRQVVAAMAEYERKITARRTSAALRLYQSQGRRMSARVPFGWRVDPANQSRIIEDEQEQATLKIIMDRHQKGESNNHIAKTLDPRTSRVGHWHHDVIRRIIMRNSR